MITITLPEELARIIEHRAQQEGATPETLAIDSLTRLLMPPFTSPDEPIPEGESLADYLKDYIGCVDSADIYPEGSRLSEDAGRKFAALMVEKRKQGKL